MTDRFAVNAEGVSQNPGHALDPIRVVRRRAVTALGAETAEELSDTLIDEVDTGVVAGACW